MASNYAEAVRVCLDRHHSSGAEFQLADNGRIEKAIAEWETVDRRITSAWANRDDATRDGAYGLALAAVEIMRGLVAVSRAETRTGADYYLGTRDEVLQDLEASIRLEVSGTDEGGQSVINGRLKQKLEQANEGCSNLPAMASVVGFRALQIISADVKKP